MSEGKGFTVADIPGLIDGASDGVGLGHDFLRHVDRCRLLLHVVDISCFEGNDPVNDIITINSELEKYSTELSKRPQIIVANKCDAIDESKFDKEKFESFCNDNGYEFLYLSAITGENLEKLIKITSDKLDTLPEIITYEADYVEEEYSSEKIRETEIRNENGVFIVEGEWLYRVMGSVNFDDVNL